MLPICLQNEVIEVLGKHIILRGIVEEIKKAPFYTILADEVTSHNVSYCPIVSKSVLYPLLLEARANK